MDRRTLIITILTFMAIGLLAGNSSAASLARNIDMEVFAPDTTAHKSKSKSKTFDEQWVRSFKKPDEGLMKILINYYKIPENISRVFFCLALSNTKRFKDDNLMAAQNLYCLCDENNLGRYFTYSHWSESVTDILSIYHQELGNDMYDMTDLLDCITSHYNRDKIIEMSKYHEMYFGKPLPIRSNEDNELRKKKGGLPW